jgi:hypothetical protein
MNNDVMPTFEAQGAKIATVLSDNGREFCGRPNQHHFRVEGRRTWFETIGQVYWTANARDAEMHLTQQTAGNGVVTTQSYSAQTGHLIGVQAGPSNTVANLSFNYDVLGNLTSRSDATQNVSETFLYDNLNRLTKSTVALTPTPLVKDFSYNPIGNLLAKTDVGNYLYPAAGTALPHAVSGISGGTISTTFTVPCALCRQR